MIFNGVIQVAGGGTSGVKSAFGTVTGNENGLSVSGLGFSPSKVILVASGALDWDYSEDNMDLAESPQVVIYENNSVVSEIWQDAYGYAHEDAYGSNLSFSTSSDGFSATCEANSDQSMAREYYFSAFE